MTTNLLNTGVSAGPGTPLPTAWSPAGSPSDIAVHRLCSHRSQTTGQQLDDASSEWWGRATTLLSEVIHEKRSLRGNPSARLKLVPWANLTPVLRKDSEWIPELNPNTSYKILETTCTCSLTPSTHPSSVWENPIIATMETTLIEPRSILQYKLSVSWPTQDS